MQVVLANIPLHLIFTPMRSMKTRELNVMNIPEALPQYLVPVRFTIKPVVS